MRILVEASGSLVSGYLIKAIQAAGHQAVASDINPNCVGRYLADDFIQMPNKSDPMLWFKIGQLLSDGRIDLVIPSFDEMLLGWSQSKHIDQQKSGAYVLVSPPEVIETFLDKWKAYEFFVKHGIPTPSTSLKQDFPLVKPRLGRGGRGVRVTKEKVDMSGLISQELIRGIEYTVDVLCNNDSEPLYIVVRQRLEVKDGKSTEGVVIKNLEIEKIVRKLCSASSFRGAINIQFFCDLSGRIFVIEVNPRVAGGMALGFAATENWIPLMVSLMSGNFQFNRCPVKYGLGMKRYYAEVFVSND